MTLLDEFDAAINSSRHGAVQRWARRTDHPAEFAQLIASIRALLERYEQDGEESGVFEQYERKYLQRLVRVRRLADRIGAVAEAADFSAFHYGVVARGEERTMAIATGHGDGAGALIVAARAPSDPMGHLGVVCSLASTRADTSGLGRSVVRAPGSHCFVMSSPSRPPPALASRWLVDSGSALHGALAAEDIVAVSPAGGSLVHTDFLVSLEQEIVKFIGGTLRTGEALRLDVRSMVHRRIEKLRANFAKLGERGWTPDVEPFVTREGSNFFQALQAHADPAAVLEAMGWGGLSRSPPKTPPPLPQK